LRFPDISTILVLTILALAFDRSVSRRRIMKLRGHLLNTAGLALAPREYGLYEMKPRVLTQVVNGFLSRNLTANYSYRENSYHITLREPLILHHMFTLHLNRVGFSETFSF
jgi:hypothetical protein